MNIIIQPFAQKLRPNAQGVSLPNPKTFPYWGKLVAALPEHNIIQIGVKGEEQFAKNMRLNMSLQDIKALLEWCDTWIAVDSFLQHLSFVIKKPGIVIFSQSDPLIFGYKQNINLLKDRAYLREDQFKWWEDQPFNADAFPDISDIVAAVNGFQPKPKEIVDINPKGIPKCSKLKGTGSSGFTG